jgi:cystathionine beta-lyase/cystathionine gamma-synthase
LTLNRLFASNTRFKMKNKASKLTLSVHAGSEGDPRFGGLTNPIYTASAYNYEEIVRYPRYFNTPNQNAVVKKMAAIENAEDGIVFSSGMAAILTSMFALLKTGDHIVFQNDLYGGTHFAAFQQLSRYGIEFTMVDAADPRNFEKAIKKNTRVIYVETPSNPLLKITDLAAVSRIAKKHGLITMIDNTFASPVNQNPVDLGIDIILHSGTKYIGGHSDICCGVMVGSKKLANIVRSSAALFGGSLDANTCYLVERSLKTIVLRVNKQNENASTIAEFLDSESKIGNVYYPGLKKHPGHSIAKKQMPGGFGGMLSFEVKSDPLKFIKKLSFIRKAVSLGGVESTICSPFQTSHSKLTAAERLKVGISDKLVRLSVGIEDTKDLIDDIKSAL